MLEQIKPETVFYLQHRYQNKRFPIHDEKQNFVNKENTTLAVGGGGGTKCPCS